MRESPIIEVENLGKHYRLGNIGLGSLIDDARSVARRLGLPCRPPDPSRQFPALKQISFEVNRGEAFGIIGHNGAGKSTLLKILSRITEPTTGKAVLRGRVASLLEVGTGFHPDMTGRENIFLNGALCGLTRNEIKESFDSIV
ncbi:MAG: ATP-binding cassette domain-containing protein, partial [Verrucomicrobiota bacterium]|nr:ATP-binding cassette domain-containing protein [Verrucomicrobiota bacterium]